MTENKTLREDKEAPEESGKTEAPATAAEPDPLAELGQTAQSAEAELFPPSETAPALADPTDEADAPAGDVSGESDDEVDGPATFASPEAPWVGAEKKWLNGEEGAPDASASGQDNPADAAAKPFPMIDVEGDSAILSAQIPVLQSIMPPASQGIGLGFKLGIVGILVVVVCAAAAVVYWMNERFSAREQEILALRASDKQDVVRLERQIQDLLSRGGAENQARANELQIELRAAREATGSEGDTDDSDAERRRRQRNGTDGIEEGAPAGAGSEAAARTSKAGAIDDDPYREGDSFQYVKDPVADLLDNAVPKPQPAATEAPAPPAQQGATDFPLGGTELPLSPSRDQVKAAMDSITPQVRSCGQGGRIVLSLAVAGATGRVVSAEPTGDHAGTPIGLCAARAVKLAKFPSFRQDRLQIKYPFDL